MRTESKEAENPLLYYELHDENSRKKNRWALNLLMVLLTTAIVGILIYSMQEKSVPLAVQELVVGDGRPIRNRPKFRPKIGSYCTVDADECAQNQVCYKGKCYDGKGSTYGPPLCRDEPKRNCLCHDGDNVCKTYKWVGNTRIKQYCLITNTGVRNSCIPDTRAEMDVGGRGTGTCNRLYSQERAICLERLRKGREYRGEHAKQMLVKNRWLQEERLQKARKARQEKQDREKKRLEERRRPNRGPVEY